MGVVEARSTHTQVKRAGGRRLLMPLCICVRAVTWSPPHIHLRPTRHMDACVQTSVCCGFEGIDWSGAAWPACCQLVILPCCFVGHQLTSSLDMQRDAAACV